MASFYQAGEFENFDIYGQYRLVELETGIGSNTGQEVAVLGEGLSTLLPEIHFLQ